MPNPDILARICATTLETIAACKALRSEAELMQIARNQEAPRGFYRALQSKQDAAQIGLIAEIKKASPSHGLIREDFDPAALARAYAEGGATCLSILTDEPYFQGHLDYIAQAKAACALPVLRKDFMLDSYQVTEARAAGADCILLILAALADHQAVELEAAAFELGMDVLLEVHDEAEAERALALLKSPLFGVNNRNLRTLTIDLATSEVLAPLAQKAGRLPICESGIQTHADIQRMQACGVHCFLVGESLMRQGDVTLATQTLLGAA